LVYKDEDAAGFSGVPVTSFDRSEAFSFWSK
jgi:hypothetical protein